MPYMRRKPGTLLPLEIAICEVAIVFLQRGVPQFHGYSLAKELKHAGDTRLLTAYGTLYRALDRLEQMGYLRSEMESAHLAAAESRPGRRLYKLTAQGQHAIAESSKSEHPSKTKRSKKGWSPA